MKKTVMILLVAVVLAVVVWRVTSKILESGGQSGQATRPPVAVEVQTISIGYIRDVREFTGTVYPIYQYVVAPKVSGRVLTIRKRIGDFVRTGEQIARIDDAEYQQAVLESEANLKIAQASLNESKSQFDLARQELERVQSLQKKGIASPSELDTATSNYSAQEARFKLAQAQVEQREAALRSARIRLSYTVLQATEEGYVGERFVDEGALLAPNSPVVSIIGLDSVLVRTTIIERDYGLVKAGQTAEIEVDAFPGQVFKGLVARVAPMLDENSRVAQMEIGVDNANRMLKPGMFTKVRVILAEKDNARIVSARAVVRRNGIPGVFLVDPADKSVKFIEITPGITARESIEIAEPAVDGTVVTLGQHLLSDGSIVILPEQGAPGEPGSGGGGQRAGGEGRR